MKKTSIRIMALLLVMLMISVFVAGCGAPKSEKESPSDSKSATVANSQETEEETKPAFNVTLKFAFPGDEPKAQGEVNDAITEKMKADGLGDFKFEYTFIPWDQYWNKLGLIAAGGEEYDLTWTHISMLPGLVNKKAMAPLDDALKAYGQELMKSTPEYCFKQASFNGQLYALPRVMPTAESGNFIQIRGDLRKKYGIPEIKTVDGLEKYFAAIKSNEPDMIPYYNDKGLALTREYGDMFFPIGDSMQFPLYVDPTDTSLTVKNFFESDIFKNIVGKMREWMQKGYIPKELPTNADTDPMLYAGKVASTWSVVLKTTERIDSFKASIPQGELENVFLNPEKPKYVFNTVDNMLSVFSTSKHVNESVAFVNWFRSSQENYDLFSYGIKDVNYKLDGNAVSYDGIAPEHSYVPINWSWNDIQYARFSKYISAQDVERLKNWQKDAVVTPLTGFTVDQEPIKTEMAQLNAVISEYVPILYNYGMDWDSTMDKFKQKLKDAGIEKVIQEVQKQLDAYKAAK